MALWRYGSHNASMPQRHNAIPLEAIFQFIDRYDGDQQEVLQYLHNLLVSFPDIEPKLRYKIPFYYRKSWICYLNPIKKTGIELCFTRGNELSNSQGLLQAKDRKQIRGIVFEKVVDIPTETLIEILQEAFLLDETVPYQSKNKKRK